MLKKKLAPRTSAKISLDVISFQINEMHKDVSKNSRDIESLKQQVANELARTEWYITRNTEKSTAIPSAITTHRDLVRTRQATMETQITNAADTPALETLYTYTTDGDGVHSRPLGELPTLES